MIDQPSEGADSKPRLIDWFWGITSPLRSRKLSGEMDADAINVASRS